MSTTHVLAMGGLAAAFAWAIAVFPDKPPGWYLVLIGGSLFVFARHRGKPFLSRIVVVVVSVSIAVALGPEFADRFWKNENLSILFFTVFGYLILEVLYAVIADIGLWKKFVSKRLGVTENDKET